MKTMRIGFSKSDITPPLGTELGGYAGYRPSSGVHDPLYCKAVVLEQSSVRYALIVMDLLCVDEALYLRIADAVAALGIAKERLIVSAIHTHASPRGVIPGEGALARVNSSSAPKNPAFMDYIQTVIEAAADACSRAVESLECFEVCATRGALPQVGSERHTGAAPAGALTVVQCRTESGKLLTLYNFPCHPTVMSAANLQVSADFAAGIEELLGSDMAVFVNGAAGDISTRFTRRESSFAECARMSRIVAEQIRNVICEVPFTRPEPLYGIHTTVTLRARQVETPENAQKRLEKLTAQWKAAEAEGADPATVRTLKSYAEGAGLNLQFSKTMGDLRQLHLPVTVFRFCGLDFATVPGELFSALQPEHISIIGYANGYYRYIGGEAAYEANYYEALAAIIARGEGERLVHEIEKLRQQLNEHH
ncbi:MAG: neutral/alkaline non-lysosomal ceramidase N-terminal domain-containing protein [Oscillospiraceae bacterium]|nr:neutral/alkaline non-lysosomal ceramidase N-terminal domain-containing protein [Oscillospiraceae bacterium]